MHPRLEVSSGIVHLSSELATVRQPFHFRGADSPHPRRNPTFATLRSVPPPPPPPSRCRFFFGVTNPRWPLHHHMRDRPSLGFTPSRLSLFRARAKRSASPTLPLFLHLSFAPLRCLFLSSTFTHTFFSPPRPTATGPFFFFRRFCFCSLLLFFFFFFTSTRSAATMKD
jgi:hypothetical protein